MKQTAVNWLIEQLENHNGVTRAGFEKCIQQAKEMEKKQLFLAANTSAKSAYKAGQKSMYCGCYEISGCTSFEDWLYNKTFKSE